MTSYTYKVAKNKSVKGRQTNNVDEAWKIKKEFGGRIYKRKYISESKKIEWILY